MRLAVLVALMPAFDLQALAWSMTFDASVKPHLTVATVR